MAANGHEKEEEKSFSRQGAKTPRKRGERLVACGEYSRFSGKVVALRLMRWLRWEGLRGGKSENSSFFLFWALLPQKTQKNAEI
jgi:hypothetical protein